MLYCSIILQNISSPEPISGFVRIASRQVVDVTAIERESAEKSTESSKSIAKRDVALGWGGRKDLLSGSQRSFSGQRRLTASANSWSLLKQE